MAYRKHGIVTVAFDREDFSDINTLMLARHSKNSSENSTTLHYTARRKCKNILKFINTAHELYCDMLFLTRRRSIKRRGKEKRSPVCLCLYISCVVFSSMCLWVVLLVSKEQGDQDFSVVQLIAHAKKANKMVKNDWPWVSWFFTPFLSKIFALWPKGLIFSICLAVKKVRCPKCIFRCVNNLETGTLDSVVFWNCVMNFPDPQLNIIWKALVSDEVRFIYMRNSCIAFLRKSQ